MADAIYDYELSTEDGGDTYQLGESIKILTTKRGYPITVDDVYEDSNIVDCNIQNGYFIYTPSTSGRHVITTFSLDEGIGYQLIITVTEPVAEYVTWSINNKIVQSLHIGQKEIETIERVSDGAILYQRQPVYAISLISDKATAPPNENVTFTATLTLDDVAVSGETVTFTDGINTFGTSTTNSNGVATLTYSWNSEDIYNIYAIYGSIESNTINIKVEVPSLKLTFTGSQFTTSTFSGGTNQGLIGSDMVINWGDGTSESITSNTKLPSHTYTTSGIYTIKVTGEITRLGKNCFYKCTGLTNVTIPSGVTSLGDYCFRDCTGLTNITMPSSITSITTSCFYNCHGLTDITIPSNVTSLGNSCFYNCDGLTNVTIPSGVTSLGSNCFYGCYKIINYQLYWQTPPTTWSSRVMPSNTNGYFTIPHGTTANYVAKSFPSAKLIERSA